MKKILYWLPRILSILFIAFISVFALDVFGMPQWYIALPMHLIPSFVLTGLTIIAWKHERIGGLLFLIVGLATISFYHSLVISVPAFMIGALFLGRSYLFTS